jgi:flagellar biosynthesis/type III secretory pathway protein FliH
VADPRVQSGGCLVESSFGEIDARWETQLLAVVNTLRGDDAQRGTL